ncbi:MAG TPA: DUF2911 domain-containing protein [Sphingobacteriaceae bacterium]
MKKLFFLVLITGLIGMNAFAQQDKSKRPSPPAKISATTKTGVTITMDYSRPSVKGRTIGQEIAPYGKVWRSGANEATVFEVNKDVKVEGQTLPAGKYGFYSIPGEKEWTLIFNKTWKQWGTAYNEQDDALRVKVKPAKSSSFNEKLTYTIADNGTVSLLWGDTQVDFRVR